MSWEHHCCVVSKSSRKFILVQSSLGNVAQQDTVPSPKPSRIGCGCFVAVYTGAPSGAHCAAAGHSPAGTACTRAQLVPESS